MITILCRKCGSPHIRKNGHTKAGAQKYHCRACGFYGTLETQDAHRTARDDLVTRLTQEGLSQRAVARIANVSRNTVIAIVKKT
jgi:transposase-like protein